MCLYIPRHIHRSCTCVCSTPMAHMHTVMHTSIEACFLHFFSNPYMALLNFSFTCLHSFFTCFLQFALYFADHCQLYLSVLFATWAFVILLHTCQPSQLNRDYTVKTHFNPTSRRKGCKTSISKIAKRAVKDCMCTC